MTDSVEANRMASVWDYSRTALVPRAWHQCLYVVKPTDRKTGGPNSLEVLDQSTCLCLIDQKTGVHGHWVD